MNDTSEDIADTPPAPRPPLRGRRHGRIGVAAVVVLLAGYAALALAILFTTGRALELPERARLAMENRLNAGLAPAVVRVGRGDIVIDRDGIPRVLLRDVSVAHPTGGASLVMNELILGLAPGPLLNGKARVRTVRLAGAQVTLRRAADGAFTVASGAGAGAEIAAPGEAVAAIEALFGIPVLSDLRRLNAQDLTVTLEDARSGRVWQASNATLVLQRPDDAGATLTLFSEVFNGTEDLASVEMSMRLGQNPELGAVVRDMPARDIALQAPALSVLSIVDAPISGAFRAPLGEDGWFEQVAATLDLGAGALQPSDTADPIRFSSARLYLSYDPRSDLIRIDDLAAETDVLRVSGSGRAYMQDRIDGWPQSWLGQMAFSQIDVAAADRLERDLSVGSASVDMRIRLDPFSLEIGQGHLRLGTADLAVTARIAADATGWRTAFDARAATAGTDTVLAPWPVTARPGLRKWLATNVEGGTLRNVELALRTGGDAEPRVAFGFDFDEAQVRVMPHLPPISAARGYAAMFGDRFSVSLAEGQMTDPGFGAVDIAGSTITIPDTRQRRSRAELDLRTRGEMPAILSILDNRPFEVLKRSGRTPDFVTGAAEARTEVTFPIADRVAPHEVVFHTAGLVQDARSEAFLASGAVVAPEIAVRADNAGLKVSGAAVLGTVPAEIEWTQGFGPDAGGSRLTGALTISPELLAEAGIAVGPLNLTGAAPARLSVDIGADGTSGFELTSALAGLGLAIPAIGWAKPQDTDGAFSVAGLLLPDRGPDISALRLAAPGLEAEGRLEFGADGAFSAARFDRVRVGDWLDAPVTIASRGATAPPRIEIAGGTLDLRRAELGGGSGRAAPASLLVMLDRLIVSDGIVLEPFTARLDSPVGLGGPFEGRVGGRSPVTGDLVPQAAGTAIRLQSSDAGGVIRDTGLIRGATGGEMSLVMVPEGDAPGGYRGQLTAADVRLEDAPAIARLLDAVSIVGLLDELRGEGIVFDTVSADFRLRPDGVVLERASAVGASMGLSLDGVYNTEARTMDMQGVISPFYLVNGIGSVLTRRGEGLFGITFRMAGPVDNPRIEINPLSILTPGMFREIFRRPPPQIETQ